VAGDRGSSWAWAGGAAALLGSLAFLANSSLVFHDTYVHSQLPILYREAIGKLRRGESVDTLPPEERQVLLVESFRGSFASLEGLAERHDGKESGLLLRDVALDAFDEKHGPSFWGPPFFRERQLASFLLGVLAFGPYLALAGFARLRRGPVPPSRPDWD
jgi:hypothetical protein